MTVVVEARGLTKRYRRGPETVHALRGVDLRIDAGELVAVAGASGSGKTTLLNVLVGWEQPDDGVLTWADGSTAEQDWGRIAVLPQRLGLAEELTLGENVFLPARLGDRAPVLPLDEALGRMGLAHLADRLPAEVSLGEQQRAAVARTLLLGPRLVLADEPTGHQDESWASAVLGQLAAACAAGSACLVATHDPEVLERVDRVIRLEDGALAPA